MRKANGSVAVDKPGNGKTFSVFFERPITSLKVVYFTVFYTKITHKERISETMHEELMGYLKMDGVGEMKNLDEQETENEEPAMRPATT